MTPESVAAAEAEANAAVSDGAAGAGTAGQLIAYIREQFLDGDPRGELTETTPLLEWGVLNSLKMAQLLAFLRNGLPEGERVKVPALEVTAENFRSVRSIAALVDGLARR